MPSLPAVRLLSLPPTTVRSLTSKPLGVSLKLNVRVAVSLRSRRALSLLIVTLGVSVSPVIVRLLLALPLLPASSL